MSRFLLWGSALSGNLGGPSIIASVCECLRTNFGSPEIVFVPQTREIDREQAEAYAQQFGFRIIPIFGAKEIITALAMGASASLLRKIGIQCPGIFRKNRVVKEIMAADCVMDTRGISQTDYFYKKARRAFSENFILYAAYLLGKPTVKFTQDMGPFRKIWNRVAASFFLRKYSRVYARGIITKELLNEIGVSKNVLVSPDTAFLFQPLPNGDSDIDEFFERSRAEGREVVGLSVSWQIDSRSRIAGEGPGESTYVRKMKQFVRTIVEQKNVNLIFLSNEVTRPDGYDDALIGEKILDALRDKSRGYVVKRSLDASILKQSIARCDLIVASRYHTIVAALSQARPTLVTGWGFKYDQLLEMFHMREYLMNHVNFSTEECLRRFDKLWSNRHEIIPQLQSRSEIVKQEVRDNAAILKDCVSPTDFLS